MWNLFNDPVTYGVWSFWILNRVISNVDYETYHFPFYHFASWGLDAVIYFKVLSVTLFHLCTHVTMRCI